MSNTPVQNWVKNVYSMGTQGVVTGAYSYTGTWGNVLLTNNLGVKPHSYTHNPQSFSPTLYTRFLHKLHLLIHRLSTLSTPPTITKMKEKKKGNT